MTIIERLRHKISPLEDKEFTKTVEARLRQADLESVTRPYRGEPSVALTSSEMWEWLFPDRDGSMHEYTLLGRSLQALLWERTYLRGTLVFTKTIKEIQEDGF